MTKSLRQKDRLKSMDQLAGEISDMRLVIGAQNNAISKLTAQMILITESLDRLIATRNSQLENQRLTAKRREFNANDHASDHAGDCRVQPHLAAPRSR